MVQGPSPGHGEDGEELPGSSPSSPAGGGGRDEAGAGRTRRPDEAAGFADGAAADVLAPGPQLAGLLHAVAGTDGAALGTLTEAEVLGVVAAARRMAAWGAWAETVALAEFGQRRAAPGEPAGVSRGAADEIGWKNRMTWQSAADRMARACATAERLPCTLAALRDGRIDPGCLTMIADLTSVLTPEDVAEADRLLAEAAAHKTYGELRAAAARLVMRLDPDAVRRRKEEAAKRDAHVRLFREDSGNAGLMARELPAADALASWQHIEQRALDLRAAGVEGSLRELRVLATLDLLQERDTRDSLPPPGEASGPPGDSDPGVGSGPDDGSDEDGRSADPGSGGPAGAGEGDAPAGDGAASSRRDGRNKRGHRNRRRSSGNGQGGGTGLAAQPVIVIPWEALAGGPSGPGEIPGFGMLDPETARDLLAAACRNAQTRACVTILGPDGTARFHGCAPGRPDFGEYLAKRTTRARAGPERSEPGATNTTAAELIRRLRVRLVPITRDTCGHQHAEPGYTPSRRLRHLVSARNTTCTAPGCGAAASKCDLDHTIAWDKGGITCECDLAPLCRHHHRVKQNNDWRLEQPEPGLLTWRTPAGLEYTTGPTDYRAA
ncbi:MAG: DUF222 domain-containing protein [Streptosporangiaceae bacterium]|nr:DUF222 domain-containing protein [Streptosporangiaceae bacterium]